MRGGNWRRLGALIVAAWIAASGGACAHVVADPPLDSARTVKDLLATLQTTQGDLHIILIHGMRVADRGTWNDFRGGLCRHVPKPCQLQQQAPITDRLMLRRTVPSANYFGTEVWGDDQSTVPDTERSKSWDKWVGSQPFVDHYRYRVNGRFIYVHEINYWPMLLAFKCEYIVYYETQLIGPHKTNINFCADGDPKTMHFAWFGPIRAKQLQTLGPLSGGAPIINAGLKSEILDWGITDAVLSLGTLKYLLRESVRCAFTDIAGLDDAAFDRRASEMARQQPDAGANHDCFDDEDKTPPTMKAGSQFAVMSHSLGAFLLMDTFLAAAGDEDPQTGQPSTLPPCETPQAPAGSGRVESPTTSGAKTATAAPTSADVARAAAAFVTAQKRYRSSEPLCFVLRNSGTLYFFANQFPLIELGRTQIDTRKTPGDPAFKSALELWADIGVQQGQTKQIVAFSDPGDILTFEVPPIKGATVYNAYPRNSFRWFGLVEDPVGAHVNYMTNPDVLGAVFGQ